MPYFSKETLEINNVYNNYLLAKLCVVNARRDILSGNIPPTLVRFEEFRYVNPSTVSERFEDVIRELDFSSMLMMLSAVEGSVLLDFRNRVSKKKEFRSLKAKSKKTRITLEDILDVWMPYSEVSLSKAINDLKSTLNLRHWLAHGRYFNPRLRGSGKYIPDDILTIGLQVIEGIKNSTV